MSLILFADDHGRGPAGARWLAHKLQLEVALVQTALEQLEQHGLIDCYQVGRHTYYFICRWHEWETLSRPSQPKYPAPPSPSHTQAHRDPGGQKETSKNFSGHPQENPGEAEKSLLEEEEEGKENKKRREQEEEWAPSSPSANPLTLSLEKSTETRAPRHPVVGSNQHALSRELDREQLTGADQHNPPLSPSRKPEMAAQLGSILQLPHNDALSRLVEEFLPDPGLSLIAEADAARAWIDDLRRNRKDTPMSLSFFRRWLLREQENKAQRCSQILPTQAKARRLHATERSKPGSSTLSVQDEPNPYKAFFDRRISEIETAFDAGVPMEEILSGRVSYAPSA